MAKHIGVATVASGCLQAWSSGDLDRTRALLAKEVTFDGPLGSTRGADAYIEGSKGMVKMVERADQREVFVEGDDVCIIYDLVTKAPPARIPTAGWYQVRDGKITAVRAFFDPRPLVPAGAGDTP
jgi:ketosteroid isomerase-like protein